MDGYKIPRIPIYRNVTNPLSPFTIKNHTLSKSYMQDSHPQLYHVTIPKAELSSLPMAQFSGEIKVVDTEEEAVKAVEALRRERIVGFDTETRPNFKKGVMHKVALIQLSSHDTAYLFRLCKIGLPQVLADFLEDTSITKIGLSLHDDFHNLKMVNNKVNPDGFIDLQPFVKDFLIADNSLARIYAILFGKRISKSQQLSNWEAPELTAHQQAYASLDAKACLDIYDYLLSGKFQPSASQYYTPIESEE